MRLHLFLGSLFFGFFACAQNTNTLLLDRLETNEAKLAQLQSRLVSVEEKTKNLDTLDTLLREVQKTLRMQAPKKRGPNPATVYSVPIEGNPYLGPKHAKVTIVKGYDFYCSYCDRVLSTLQEIRRIYGNDVKVVFKSFVIKEEYALLPARAACAAHLQGKFMPMFEQIWKNGLRARAELTQEKLLGIAKSLQLNIPRFTENMKNECVLQVQNDYDALNAVGANGTPVFYINGRFLSGALPLVKFRQLIDVELAKANAIIKAGSSIENYYSNLVKKGKKSL